MNNIDVNLKNMGQNEVSDTDTSTEPSSNKLPTNENDNMEETDDPLNEYRQVTNETCLQSVLPDYPVTVQTSERGSLGNEIYNIAPGEKRHPVSIMTDKKCEELAFPILFPKGRFGYLEERKIKLTSVKYFNARLLHYSGRFATNSEYLQLFFAQFVIEQKKVSDSINIALKKIQGQPLTASQIESDVNKLKSLVCQDQAYLFLRQIPGTPPYWQKFMYEVIAMNLDDESKSSLLNRRKEILCSVKQKIDEVLNPSKENYDATLTETDILNSIGISEDEYYWALSTSPDSDFDLHLKRPVDSCFINNYFVAGVKGFAANVDLQPVFNHYKYITYVCSYFTKDETECSQAIGNAAKEAKSSNMNVRDGLKKIGAAFLSKREVIAQECVYRCMHKLWLRKIFPGTVFVNTNLPEKRVFVTKTKNELDKLDDDSTDIYKSNIIERYSLRPKAIPAVDKLFYYIDYRTDYAETNDSQPDVLNDNLLESHNLTEDREQCLPPKIKLMNKNEYMKSRKVKRVLRFHKYQENSDLKDDTPIFSDPNESFNEQQPSHLDPTQSNQHSSGIITYHNQPSEISDDELWQSVRSLNPEQRCAYDMVLSWCRQLIKNMNNLKPVEVKPIYLFLTGGGGAGKSHLIKTIYHTAVKTFRHPHFNPELATVLLLAPTGVAAINIDGITVNTGLLIPKETGDCLRGMSDQKKTQYRISLKDLKLIIIDEISMIGNITLLHVHQRLKEIFEDDIKVIQSRCTTTSDPNYPSDALHIWAENTPVNEHNQKKLETIQSPLFLLKAKDQYPKNVNKQDIDRVLARGRSEICGLDFEIHIKEGARVMLTTNINIQDRLINGQMGTVVKIQVNGSNIPIILYIKFDDENAGKTMINTSANSFARENHLVLIEPVLAKFKVRPGKPSSPEIQRIQFPVALSWACTVHKVQGLTLENVVVSLELNKQRSFNYGQIYVALSRATSLQGLHILGEIQSKHIKANPKVHKEYERLRNSCLRTFTKHKSSNSSFVTISLLNMRSLRKHSNDIKLHLQLFHSDVLAFTETQLLANDSDAEIAANLKPFKIYRQDHDSDKYSSMAIEAIKFVLVDTKLQESRSFLLLYRKNNSSVSQYIEALRYLLNTTLILNH
ncbi:ATP-dependent DNA helicase PIF1 [Paramuricea clavata]|uniref:ATP-dependent DNA helicase n=1 Tax=Paramuricea clavata TaxID=317549 RepID=A0A6S7H628_PARCT|nr:ATP-dependent DNA helicase PIF1 [Paramuricea clavata]